jgi:hypothetical protein
MFLLKSVPSVRCSSYLQLDKGHLHRARVGIEERKVDQVPKAPSIPDDPEKAESGGRNPFLCLALAQAALSGKECMITPFPQDHWEGWTSSDDIIIALLHDLAVHAVDIVQGDLNRFVYKFVVFPTVLHVRDSLRAHVAHHAILKETGDTGWLGQRPPGHR